MRKPSSTEVGTVTGRAPANWICSGKLTQQGDGRMTSCPSSNSASASSKSAALPPTVTTESRRLPGRAEALPVGLGERLAQGGQAAAGRIAGEPLGQGAPRRLHRHRRGGEVGLAGPEVDHGDALGPQLGGPAGHAQGGGLADAVGAMRELHGGGSYHRRLRRPHAAHFPQDAQSEQSAARSAVWSRVRVPA